MAVIDRQGVERARRHVQLFALLMFALVVVWSLSLPWALAGIAFAVAAAWAGVVSLVDLARLRRAGQPGRGTWLVAAGLGLTAVLLLSLISRAIYYPIIAERERCLAGALTDTAAQACQEHAQDRIDNLLSRLRRMEQQNR